MNKQEIIDLLSFNREYDNNYWDYTLQEAASDIVREAVQTDRIAVDNSPGKTVSQKNQPDTYSFKVEIKSSAVYVDTTKTQTTIPFILEKKFTQYTTGDVINIMRRRGARLDEAEARKIVVNDSQKIREEITKEERGCRAMNEIRKYIPNFMYTYHVDAPRNTFYFERVKGLTLEQFMALKDEELIKMTRSPTQVLESLVTQLAFSLHEMRHRGYFHNDLHAGNIIMRPCDPGAWIQYVNHVSSTKHYVPTHGFIATIIDFGRVRRVGQDNTFCNEPVHRSGFDFTKFLLHMVNCIVYRDFSTFNKGFSSNVADKDLAKRIEEALGQVYGRQATSARTIPVAELGRGREEKVSIVKTQQRLSKKQPEKFCMNDNGEGYFFPTCSSKLSKLDSLDIFNLLKVDPKFYTRDVNGVKARGGVVIACNYSGLCKASKDYFLDMFLFSRRKPAPIIPQLVIPAQAQAPQVQAPQAVPILAPPPPPRKMETEDVIRKQSLKDKMRNLIFELQDISADLSRVNALGGTKAKMIRALDRAQAINSLI
jgi:serine/threonine protein kinase